MHVADGRRGRLGIAVAVGVGVGLWVGVLAWPGAGARPDGVVVAVTGPAPAVAAFREQAGERAGVTTTVVADRDALVDRLRHRTASVGVVISTTAPEVLEASAAGASLSAVAQQLQAGLQRQVDAQVLAAVTKRLAAPATATGRPGEPQAAPATSGAGVPTAPQVRLTDVVPLSADDPFGIGLTMALIPLIVGGLLGGVLIALSFVGAGRRLLATLGFAVVGGAVGATVLGPWLGVLPGGFAAVGGVVALSLLASSSVVVGLHALAGRIGIGVAAALTALLGLPLSALAVPWQFLPDGWDRLGQWLVPGASVTLVRDVGYFPAADAGAPWTTLALWAVLGLVLTLVADRARRTAGRVPDLPQE